MIWIVVIAFAAIAGALVWGFARLPRAGLELAIAAVLVGVAGYVWQGSPTQPGAPVAPKSTGFVPPDKALAMARAATMDRYSDAARVVETADTLGRLGLTREAVIVVKTGLRKEPDNVDLWVGGEG